jgi:hypothetical protein
MAPNELALEGHNPRLEVWIYLMTLGCQSKTTKCSNSCYMIPKSMGFYHKPYWACHKIFQLWTTSTLFVKALREVRTSKTNIESSINIVYHNIKVGGFKCPIVLHSVCFKSCAILCMFTFNYKGWDLEEMSLLIGWKPLTHVCLLTSTSHLSSQFSA